MSALVMIVLPLFINFVLGFKVNKPSKILIKTSSSIEYIKLDIQTIETPRIDDLII